MTRFPIRVFLFAVLAVACAPAPERTSSAPPPAAAGAPAATALPEPLPMKIGYAAPSASFAQVWIGQEAGLYARHGLRAEVVNVGPNGAAPLIGGDVDVIQVAGPSVFAANLEGGETLWILVPLTRPVLYLMARPEITRGEDLRGRAVGVSARGTFTDQFMRVGLRHLGLDADRDVTVLATGGPPESVAATTTGRVAAYIGGPPSNLRAREAGLHTILDLSTLDVAYPAAGVATTRKVLRERPEVLRRFARAYVEANYVFLNDPAFAQEVIGKYTATTSAADLAESYYAFRDITALVPMPRVEAMQTALELMSYDLPRAREADPHDFFDDRLVKELEASGFFTTLGR